jgi:mono/diheme cytochrome c family protein
MVFVFSVSASTFVYANGQARKSVAESLEDRAMFIFRMNCSSCHGVKKPPKGMRLDDPLMVKQTVIDVPSKEREGLKRIDTQFPDKSYLLMKISGHKSILGEQMPPAYPLNNNEIKVIRDWLLGLAGKQGSSSSPGAGAPGSRPAHHFAALKLINLPTAKALRKKQVSFLIAHRFYPEVKSGFESLFGLDGPSTIMFSLGYGFSDKASLTLSRTNLNKVVELTLHWQLLGGSQRGLPIDAVLHVGGGFVTQDIPNRKRFDSRRLKFNTQLSLSYALNRRLAFLLVPSFSTHTNHWEEDPENTLALGLGMRYGFGSNYSLIAEWTPVLSGYRDASNAWGIGFEKKMGKHVFQLFVVNSVGLTSDQYITGGDLKLENNKFRLGFNIFRIF